MSESFMNPLKPPHYELSQMQSNDDASIFSKYPFNGASQFKWPLTSRSGQTARQIEQEEYPTGPMMPASNKTTQFKTPTSLFFDGPTTPLPDVPASFSVDGPTIPLPNVSTSFSVDGPTTPLPDVLASFSIDGPTTPLPLVAAPFSVNAPITPPAGLSSVIIDPRISGHSGQNAQWLSLNNALSVSSQMTQTYQDAAGEIKKIGGYRFFWKSVHERLFQTTFALKLALILICSLLTVYSIRFMILKHINHLTFARILFVILFSSFMLGGLVYLRNIVRSRRYFKDVGSFKLTIDELLVYARQNNQTLPKIAIFVPARNEGYVIENTVRRLMRLDYVKSLYRVFVITDERELDDNVELLTKEVVDRLAEKINKEYGINIVQSIEVPKWYSGVFGSNQKTYEKSTKGRALNYALQTIYHSELWQQIDFIGVVDADGRLHVNVLKEVAYKALKSNARVLQGPVFQISNFADVSLVGVIAALELALHHLTELSHHLVQNKFQFLAGTNYYIAKTLLVQCGAWNQHALVEDAELAMRLYIKQKIHATWLSCFEIEQTPPNFKVYRRQRERWVRGHFDLIPDIVHSGLTLQEKMNFLSKIAMAQFRFILDISFPGVALAYVILGIFPRLNFVFSGLLIIFLINSFLIWDIYGMMYRKLVPYMQTPVRKTDVVKQSIKLFFFSPVMVVLQSIPRTIAFYKYIFSINQGVWYKTERTKETINE